VVRVFHLSDAAVSTSGTYQQYFQYRGRRYHHLLDPGTAAPRATLIQSLTVQADTCMHADVATTACFGMSPGQAADILGRRAPGSRVVSTI
jgi:thiamine biosynthesis lipoprotein